MLYPSADFDQELMDEMDSGVPISELINQINSESENQKLKAKKELESHVMDPKYWQQHDISPEEDLSYEIQYYKLQISEIDKYKAIRIKYVKKEISKEEFIKETKIYKVNKLLG